MMKEYKAQIIASSAVVVFPALFGMMMWNALPDVMAVHWGADGVIDSFGSKAFAVFGLPAVLLPIHLICVAATLFGQKQIKQNRKALNLIFWIVPLSSLFGNGMIYAAAFGRTLDLMMLIPALLAVLFLVLGNYLPKIKPNRTLGIRISWTLNNEENWYKTHRLGGKVWVISGVWLLFSMFLPFRLIMPMMLIAILSASVIPLLYSYSIYKKHQKEGIVYNAAPKRKFEKIVTGIAAVVTSIVLVAVAVLMFSGEIAVQCEATSFKIEASYWPDLEVAYSEIEALAYRNDVDTGIRTNGFGSARLSMGTFENDEFGSYTLYAYNDADAYIVIKAGEKTLVIGMQDADTTQAVYQAMLARMKP